MARLKDLFSADDPAAAQSGIVVSKRLSYNKAGYDSRNRAGSFPDKSSPEALRKAEE